LYIARFHPPFQGISGSYRKFIGFQVFIFAAGRGNPRQKTQPVGPVFLPDASHGVVRTDGASKDNSAEIGLHGQKFRLGEQSS
jgi:hypothetical protein